MTPKLIHLIADYGVGDPAFLPTEHFQSLLLHHCNNSLPAPKWRL